MMRALCATPLPRPSGLPSSPRCSDASPSACAGTPRRPSHQSRQLLRRVKARSSWPVSNRGCRTSRGVCRDAGTRKGESPAVGAPRPRLSWYVSGWGSRTNPRRTKRTTGGACVRHLRRGQMPLGVDHWLIQHYIGQRASSQAIFSWPLRAMCPQREQVCSLDHLFF